MRRDAVRRFATEPGKFPPKMVLTKACRWVRTDAFVIDASRKCSNVIPEGPAPTPFSHLPNILAKSAWAIESVDPRGVGQITPSLAAGPSAPVEAPTAPPAAPAPVLLAPVIAPVASAPAGDAAAHSDPALGVVVAQAASVPDVPAPASASSPKAASATTVDPAPMVAPPGADPVAPALLPVAPVVPPSRPPSPDRRLSRPHSPAPQQERETSRRRRNSPRRYQQQAKWPAHPGNNGGWRGPHGRGGGGRYRPPVTMADLQREVSRAVRQERVAQSQSSLLRATPAPVAPRQAEPRVAPPPAAAFPPPVLAPSAPSPSVSAPAPGSRLHLPPVPPVAGVEFVAVGGGAAAQHSHHVAADEPLLFLTEALQPP
ncbi:unnamed protein product [Closterium sp. Naga37s-1]|nr:unnamed protein product [Closterium sp. Naga37s-1]